MTNVRNSDMTQPGWAGHRRIYNLSNYILLDPISNVNVLQCQRGIILVHRCKPMCTRSEHWKSIQKCRLIRGLAAHSLNLVTSGCLGMHDPIIY